MSPLELFFDLVYVLAVGQRSHHHLAHVGVEAGAQTLVLARAVIYAWYMTAWAANWLDPANMVVRAMLITLMFASLPMSSSIAGAFDDRGWLFVTCYLLLQLGRTAFLKKALRGRSLGRHFTNAFVWEVGVLWVSGLILEHDVRVLLWAAAVLLTSASSRCTGYQGVGARWTCTTRRLRRDTFSSESACSSSSRSEGPSCQPEPPSSSFPATSERLVALTLTFVGIVAFWWCYFQRAESAGIDVAERANDAGEASWGSTWSLTLMVLALIGTAVGSELAIARPDGPVDTAFLVLAFGSPALFLVAQTLFLFVIADHLSRPRVAAVFALAVGAAVASQLTLLPAAAIPVAVLVAVAASDTARWPARART